MDDEQIKSGNLTFRIRNATVADIGDIHRVMTEAFASYRDEISKSTEGKPNVHALTESADDIRYDIECNTVLVAEDENRRIIGTIRIKEKSTDLAYIYRFGVLPDIKNVGIGSNLLGYACDLCAIRHYKAIALHTNARFYSLARYYYGKRFFVHSTTTDKGYIRALFIKELSEDRNYDITPAYEE